MPSWKRATYCFAAIAASWLVVFGGRAEACMVCIPFPQATVVDHLLDAKVVVLARENPEQPFAYLAIEVLTGDLDSPEIDLFVNSTVRRRLALNPDQSVVLALTATRSPGYSSIVRSHSPDTGTSRNTWRSLGYASERYELVVREILARAPRWRKRAGREDRARYFMPYLADEERAIRELAYLEVGQASYDTIRDADQFVTARQLQAFLDDPQYLEWRALYILLLGVNAKPHEKEAVRAAMADRARFDQTRNLSAWATALVEIDREEAIDWLEAAYLRAPGRDQDSVLEVFKALSVHGARERSGLRERIAASYGALIKVYPSLAGWAARDLTAWNDWRFVDALGELRASGVTMDGATMYAIDYYIGEARSGRSN